MNFQRLHLDKALFYGLAALALISMFAVYSAYGQELEQTLDDAFRMCLGCAVMIGVAQMRTEGISNGSAYRYGVALSLLILVQFVVTIGKGEQRWLDLGFIRFQPAELMKLSL